MKGRQAKGQVRREKERNKGGRMGKGGWGKAVAGTGMAGRQKNAWGRQERVAGRQKAGSNMNEPNKNKEGEGVKGK